MLSNDSRQPILWVEITAEKDQSLSGEDIRVLVPFWPELQPEPAFKKWPDIRPTGTGYPEHS